MNMMRSIAQLFKIRREERWMACIALLFFILLNAMTICRYYHLFTPLSDDYWKLFICYFQISGFDPITYYVVSDWEARYDVYRHPLLAFVMYPFYLLNKSLMWLTGINCVQFIVAFIIVFCAFYSLIFIYRIFREVIELGKWDAVLLSVMLFSFAFVMLSAMVPDHFIFSMLMILLTLYISGKHIKEHREMSAWKTILLFSVTAGISLNNGLKVFFAALFVNSKRFFRPLYLIFAVFLPALLMWEFCHFEYRHFVAEKEHARHIAKGREIAAKQKQEKIALMKQQIANGDSSEASRDTTLSVVPSKVSQTKKQVFGTPINSSGFLRWTDISTSRWETAVENLFGESIQLHQDFLLKDEFRKRPMIVYYRDAYNYIIEGVIVILFFIGIWCGRKSRFLWLSLSFFFLDMALHMGLGFGINEIYIMSAHWIYVIPMAIGFIMKKMKDKGQMAMRLLLLGLVSYLYIYNSVLLLKYLFV